MEPKSSAKTKKKPFCSALCAKTAKTSPEEPQPQQALSQPQQQQQPLADLKKEDATKINGVPVQQVVASEKKPDESSSSSGGGGSCSADAEPVSMVSKWTVSEVCEFIRSLHRTNDYADDFENQEIDGQALLLLTANNLVNVMGIKLGPALKIIDSVNKLKPAQTD